MEGSGSLQIITDPDTGGTETYGSGTGTLVRTNRPLNSTNSVEVQIFFHRFDKVAIMLYML